MSKKIEGAQFVQYFGPLLEALKQLGGSASVDEATDQIAKNLSISEDTLNEVLSSGGSRFRNQVSWARFYLAKEGLIDSSKKGVWSLTEKGKSTALTFEEARNIFLNRAEIFRKQRAQKRKDKDNIVEEIADEFGAVSEDYRLRTRNILLSLSPSGFEQLSQRILREAGFIQVIVTGKSGDGGIDGHGVLQINPLVSFKVLFQCKRYKDSISPSTIRDFRGAMLGRADKGIILTTGFFTTAAKEEANRDGVPPIELIDGDKLIKLLEKLELGLKPVTTYEIDHSFFNQFTTD